MSKKLFIKNAVSGNHHDIRKYLTEECTTPAEYVKCDLLLSKSPKEYLENLKGFVGVVDSETITEEANYVKFHVDWKQEKKLYNEDGDVEETREEVVTACYLIIIEK